MKVLVCGGRDFSDRAWLYRELDALGLTPKDIVVSGGARGADKMADGWALHRGVSRIVFPANWEGEGKAAGFLRNQRMLDLGQPDLVLAFPGGAGTADMVRRAIEAGVCVHQPSDMVEDVL